MPRKRIWPPIIHRHQSGRARVRIDGVDHYLGEFGSPEATQAYLELIQRVEAERSNPSPKTGKNYTVAEVCAMYLEQQTLARKKPDGSPTTELKNIRYALRVLVHGLGTVPIKDVAPSHMRKMRLLFVNGYKHPVYGDQGAQSRRVVNANFKRARAVFQWAAQEEGGLLLAENFYRLKLIKGLLPGECGVWESPDVEPVPDDVLAATIPQLGPVVQEMVLVQLLCACRPGEIIRLRLAEVDLSGPVWLWSPKQHKNAWRKQKREIFLGLNAQAVLKPFLKRSPDTPVFSPMEAAVQNPWWSARKDGRKPGEEYDLMSYTNAIRRACKRAGVCSWSPGQLRHNAITMLTDEYSLQVASAVAGHKSLQTTLIYAKQNRDKAEDAMRLSG